MGPPGELFPPDTAEKLVHFNSLVADVAENVDRYGARFGFKGVARLT